MKKLVIIFSLLLSFSLMLCGCFPKIIIVPDYTSIGEPKIFEKDGIKLTLTDRFTETESEVGFDAYYVADFCGVVVLREEFTLEEGLAERSLEEYVSNVIENNGHAGIEPQYKDGLWFYVADTTATTQTYSFSFKGSDSFWIVQYLCRTSDAFMLEDQFFLWAKTVEVE